MPSYWEVIADAAAYWPLQETTGTVAADALGSSPASLQAGLNFSTSSVEGPLGWLASGLSFNGTTQLASIPSQTALGLGEEHSYSLWWKPNSSPPWAAQGLVETGGSINGSVVCLEGNDLVLVSTRNSTASHVSTPVATEWDRWRHVAAVQKAASLEVYIDGVLVGSASALSAWQQSGDNPGALGAFDGARWLSGYVDTDRVCYFNGSLAGVAVFSRALSAAEVVELYCGPEPTILTPPVLASSPRVGRRAIATAANWDSQLNGTLSETAVLQFSPDGLNGWEDALTAEPGEELVVPAIALGSWMRVVVRAANLGGSSGWVYSSAAQVIRPTGPATAVAGQTACDGVIASGVGQSAGLEAGTVLSGASL